MATFVSLPDDVLHLLCEGIDIETVRSLSLTHPNLSRIYQRYCCRRLKIIMWKKDQKKKARKIKYWASNGWLSFVHHLTIDDTGPERSDQAVKLLNKTLKDALPMMTGLRTLEWDLNDLHGYDIEYPLYEADPFTHLDLPPRAKFLVTCKLNEYKDAQNQYDHQTDLAEFSLSSAPRYSNLHTLHVESNYWTDDMYGMLKDTMLGCAHLRILKVRASNWRGLLGHQVTQLTPEEATRFPALKELSFEHEGFRGDMLQLWSKHGSWSSLETLTLSDGRLLQHLGSRTPVLKSLTVGSLTNLRAFLEQSRSVSALTIRGLHLDDQPRRTGFNSNTGNLRGVLSAVPNDQLTSFELGLDYQHQPFNVISNIDIIAVALLCPKLTNFVFTLDVLKYSLDDANSPDLEGYYRLDWMSPCAEAIANLPHLRHFGVVIPHLYQVLDEEGAETWVTYRTALNLYDTLLHAGFQLPKVSVTTSLRHEMQFCEYMSPSDVGEKVPRYPRSGKLTFVVTPTPHWMSKATDPGPDIFVTCPELVDTFHALARRDYHLLTSKNTFERARYNLDAITSLTNHGRPPPPFRSSRQVRHAVHGVEFYTNLSSNGVLFIEWSPERATHRLINNWIVV